MSSASDEPVRASSLEDDDGPLWVFAYGSLIWRPDFPHGERRGARVAGFVRRFWQGSTDHRGVPGAPGRVVTLVQQVAAVCQGVAFRVAAQERREVLANLDQRESGGFERVLLEAELDDGRGRRVTALTYVAREGNPNFLGPAPVAELAEQVRDAHGPSGSNREYVLELARALRALGAHDSHVYALERRLRGER